GRAGDQGDLAIETCHALLLCAGNLCSRRSPLAGDALVLDLHAEIGTKASPASGVLRIFRVFGEVGVGGQAAVERVIQLPGFIAAHAGAGDAFAIALPQRLQIVADVVEHQVGGVAAAHVGEGVAVAFHAHVDRVGVAE